MRRLCRRRRCRQRKVVGKQTSKQRRTSARRNIINFAGLRRERERERGAEAAGKHGGGECHFRRADNVKFALSISIVCLFRRPGGAGKLRPEVARGRRRRMRGAARRRNFARLGPTSDGACLPWHSSAFEKQRFERRAPHDNDTVRCSAAACSHSQRCAFCRSHASEKRAKLNWIAAACRVVSWRARCARNRIGWALGRRGANCSLWTRCGGCGGGGGQSEVALLLAAADARLCGASSFISRRSNKPIYCAQSWLCLGGRGADEYAPPLAAAPPNSCARRQFNENGPAGGKIIAITTAPRHAPLGKQSCGKRRGAARLRCARNMN